MRAASWPRCRCFPPPTLTKTPYAWSEVGLRPSFVQPHPMLRNGCNILFWKLCTSYCAAPPTYSGGRSRCCSLAGAGRVALGLVWRRGLLLHPAGVRLLHKSAKLKWRKDINDGRGKTNEHLVVHNNMYLCRITGVASTDQIRMCLSGLKWGHVRRQALAIAAPCFAGRKNVRGRLEGEGERETRQIPPLRCVCQAYGVWIKQLATKNARLSATAPPSFGIALSPFFDFYATDVQALPNPGNMFYRSTCIAHIVREFHH